MKSRGLLINKMVKGDFQFVTLAKAGVQKNFLKALDSLLRGNDGVVIIGKYRLRDYRRKA